MRAWRKAAGISQERLGELLGLHQTAISQIEHGTRPPPLLAAVALEALTADAEGGPILPRDWGAAEAGGDAATSDETEAA
jgi:transcriptional regulator with XRE-family HTH domain